MTIHIEIHIEMIPHSKQRYPTLGDYWEDDSGMWQFRVSQMKDPRYEILVLIHELIEWFLVTTTTLITMQEIDAFDMQFEVDRELGLHTRTEEPGDHPLCPYRVQHSIATGVEKILAALAGVDWNAYGIAVESL